MEQAALFWDRIADRYAKRPVADKDAYLKKLTYTQNLFTPDMEVLELGCGTGSTALTHAPLVRHIHCIDISPRMVGIAREKAAARGIGNVSFECAAIDEVKVPDASVDMVMMHSILHLLEEKEAVIARVHAMLRPGGFFVSSTACMNDGLWFMRPVMPLMRCCGRAPVVVRFFSARQLLKVIRDAGFTIDYQWRPSRAKALFVVARKP